MLLVERHRELELLADSCTSVTRGDGRLLVLTGAGGMGKTTLLRAFAEHATGSGADVRTAVSSEAERDHPFGVLAQLLRNPHGLRGLELLDHRAAEPSEALIRRLGEEFAECARRELLVLAVDDAHLADTQSLAVLHYLLRRLPMLPLLVVLTEAATPTAGSALTTGLPRHPTTTVLRLAPLSEAGVARVLADALDDPTAARLASGCHDLTGGNPLLVRAAVEELARPGAPSEQGPGWAATGDGFGRAALACLSPAVVDIARALAVLGDLANTARAARLADAPPFEVDKSVRALTAAGLLVEGRFRHPALGAAVVDHLSAPERSRLHAGAAWLLYEEGVESGAVADHLAEAGTLTEPWAVAVLRDAAAEALSAGDLDLARERLRVAQRCCANASDRAAVVLTSISLESRVDPAIAGRLLGPLVAAALAGQLAGGDVLGLVRHLVWHGRLADASACLSALDTDDPRVAVHLHAARAWLEHTCPSLLADAPRTEETTAPPILVDRGGRAAEALRAVLAEGAPDHAAVVAEELLAGLTLDEDGVAAESALLALVYAGRVDVALPRCASWLAEAIERGVPTWVAVLACTRAVIAQHLGDPLGAEEYARMALDSISAEGWGVAVAAPLAVLVWAATETGRAKDAAAWLNHPVPPATFQTRYGPLYLHARGEYHLAVGRPAAAMEDFANCGDMVRRWRIDLPTYVPWRSSAAQAHLALGAPDKAGTAPRAGRVPGAAVSRARAITLRSPPRRRCPKRPHRSWRL
ncbi:AAA family ATPase [Saccharothrix sp. MB29]|nr:AAA family ATPase [Saccharothrix sp. MB29]